MSNLKYYIFASTKTQISGFVLIDAIIFKPELAVAASDFFNYWRRKNDSAFLPRGNRVNGDDSALMTMSRRTSDFNNLMNIIC